MRTYFVLYYDSEESFSMLRDAEAGRVLKALFRYNRDGELPENLKAREALVFSQLRHQHDRERERYERKCAVNKQNIQRRWDKEPEGERELTPEDRELMAFRDSVRERHGIRE